MPPFVAAPILGVTDMNAAVSFYASFGFERTGYFDGNESYVALQRGDAQLHLMRSRVANPNHRAGAHVADAFVWVADVDPIIAAAGAAGLTPERGPEHYESSPFGTTEVVLADPSGNWVCFATADASR